MNAIFKGMHNVIWQQMEERETAWGQGREFKKDFTEMSDLSWIPRKNESLACGRELDQMGISDRVNFIARGREKSVQADAGGEMEEGKQKFWFC